MKHTKLLTGLLSTVCLLGMTGCGGGSSNPDSTPVSDNPTSSSSSVVDDYDTTDPNYYDNVEKRATFDKSNSLNFNETFDNGMSDDVFYALDGAWHTDVAGAAHNGVRSRNLFYTKDGTNGMLAIRGRGMYNRDSDVDVGKPEGGAILTKNHLGPGRYEIEMAAMPREGGVTAMWTYCTTTGNEVTSQNEIDIELGGTTKGTNYVYEWCTSWTTRTDKQTDTIDVTDKLYLNDRTIHKYTFDWYTDYKGERHVDWFIDGVLIDSMSGSMVPEHEMPLWIGVWFPPLWPGTPAFETDYMLVDSVSYTAFSSDQYYETCRSNPGYTKTVPSQANIKTISFDEIKNVNKLANGEFDMFEQAPRGSSYYGWSVSPASSGTVEQVDEGTGKAFKLTAAEAPGSGTFPGEYLYQTLTNIFEGYKLDLSVRARLNDATSQGNIEVYYKNVAGAEIGTKVIPIDSTEYKDYTLSITAPKNCYSIEIDITSEKGSVLYTNASLLYKGL